MSSPFIVAVQGARSTSSCAELAIRCGEVLVVDLHGNGILSLASDHSDVFAPDIKNVFFNNKKLLRQIVHAKNFSVIPGTKNLSNLELHSLQGNIFDPLKQVSFDVVLFDLGGVKGKLQDSIAFKRVVNTTLSYKNLVIPPNPPSRLIPSLEIRKMSEQQQRIYNPYLEFWELRAKELLDLRTKTNSGTVQYIGS